MEGIYDLKIDRKKGMHWIKRLRKVGILCIEDKENQYRIICKTRIIMELIEDPAWDKINVFSIAGANFIQAIEFLGIIDLDRFK